MKSNALATGPVAQKPQRQPRRQKVNAGLNALWMPFTPNRAFKREPRLLQRSRGVHLWTDDGRRVLDGVAGLFTCAAGHGRREIARAVHRQLRTLDYMPSFARGHRGAFTLAERLAGMLPGDLNRVFFCNSGSEAVDTAIKMALQYHLARGEAQRNLFVSRQRAYHGVNLGGTALSGMLPNRAAFGVGLANVVHMRATWTEEQRFSRGQPDSGAERAEDLLAMIQTYGAERIAACFVEPIAGSTGVLVPPQGYLERLRELCDEHGILLVFDEVITGFGRTGDTFAAESFGVTPDVITMAKALTNGAQPMGAVAVRDGVYDAIMDAAPDGAIEFFHGYTYSGHPAACAAAHATLDIFERERLFARARELSEPFLDHLFGLQNFPCVTDVRGYGLLGAVELAPGEVPGQRGFQVQQRLFDAGLHVKATGDAILLAPPFTISRAELTELRDLLAGVLGQEPV